MGVGYGEKSDRFTFLIVNLKPSIPKVSVDWYYKFTFLIVNLKLYNKTLEQLNKY